MKQKESIMLPCDFKDTIWVIEPYCIDCTERDDYCHRNCQNPKYRISEETVDHFIIKKDKVEICGFVDNYGVLGEDVFLTKEEAEQMIKNKN